MGQNTATIAKTYGDAAGYDSYMGPWSSALAPLFLEFAGLQQPALLLDVGCGTGNLLAAAAALFPEARLAGIDPSAALLRKARTRAELASARLVEGTAEKLPFADAAFDGCLSLLVLQEFADRCGPLCEMRRVTRQRGIVAACQWDFARMPVIATLVDAIAAIDPCQGERLTAKFPALIRDEAEFASAWTNTGFEEVSAARISVVRHYQDFEDLWKSLLGGSTPSTLVLSALPADKRKKVRQRMQSRFHVSSQFPELEIMAEALVVRGRA